MKTRSYLKQGGTVARFMPEMRVGLSFFGWWETRIVRLSCALFNMLLTLLSSVIIAQKSVNKMLKSLIINTVSDVNAREEEKRREEKSFISNKLISEQKDSQTKAHCLETVFSPCEDRPQAARRPSSGSAKTVLRQREDRPQAARRPFRRVTVTLFSKAKDAD